MQLTDDDVKKIAHLARLNISHEDIHFYAEKLSDIFTFIEIINSVPTDHVEPMSHPISADLHLRSDHVTEIDQHQKYQRNSAQVQSGLYLVPQVIE